VGREKAGITVRPFDYQRADTVDDALHSFASTRGVAFLGGGTNLIDLMKSEVESPSKLVDLSRLPLSTIEKTPAGGLRIGSMARNSDTANHPLVRQNYPLLSMALLSGASPQLRNMATVGGNLMQRTRCYYFVDPAYPACNKRNPGSGCSAQKGFNRIHAVLGQSEQCIATHPSDMCVALLALDATVNVRGTKGERTISMQDFHRLPGDTPQIDTNLKPGEVILSVDLPPSKYVPHFHYLKVRDRNSYAFALVSVAVGLELDNQTIRRASVAMGGVAHKPWRCHDAEQILIGASAEKDVFERAGRAALSGAKGYEHNSFKIELGMQAVAHALNLAATGRTV
jgi:xanthine dehydrogenase YagS FAD-binding subunit